MTISFNFSLPKFDFSKYKSYETKKAWVSFLVKADMLIFFPGVVVAILIAYIYGGTESGPLNYNLIQNYISDLGSGRFTPVPYMFNGLVIFTGILCLFVFYYSNQVLREIAEKELNTLSEGIEPIPISETAGSDKLWHLSSQNSKIFIIFLNLSKYFLIFGPIGLVGIGIFNEDFHIRILHVIFAAIAFVGYALGSVWIGAIALFVDTFIPRRIAKALLFVPLTSVILWLMNVILPVPPFTMPTLEWIVLICIFWWVIPIGIRLVKYMRVHNPIFMPFSLYELCVPYSFV